MNTTPSEIKQAAHLLKAGKLVAFPTETVYGLGGNALSDAAVASIYAAKGRPEFNPLIVHVRSLEDANHHVEFSERALKLAHAFWPGPLTLVLPRRKDCKLSLLVSAGLDTVAVRMPAHPLAQALLNEAGIPVAAPSANRSGRISPTDAAHVHEELGNRVAMVLDGGPCRFGIESTVVDMSGEFPVILRPGSVTLAQVRDALDAGCRMTNDSITDICHPSSDIGRVRAPGMLAAHYAPSCQVRLNATDVKNDEALLAFGPYTPTCALLTQNLSPSGNLQEAAANLFRMLRALDAAGVRCIAVMSIPEDGAQNALGIAINDRLKRAATPILK